MIPTSRMKTPHSDAAKEVECSLALPIPSQGHVKHLHRQGGHAAMLASMVKWYVQKQPLLFNNYYDYM